ncbi:hypothetical protein [Tabrizicola sp. BL-A-41-H6]
MRRFLLGTTAIAAFLPKTGRMMVVRGNDGVIRDPFGQKYRGSW